MYINSVSSQLSYRLVSAFCTYLLPLTQAWDEDSLVGLIIITPDHSYQDTLALIRNSTTMSDAPEVIHHQQSLPGGALDSYKESVRGYGYGGFEALPGQVLRNEALEKQEGTPPLTPPERTLCGLRRSTFFISLALIVVIIAIPVGARIGGSMALQSAKTSSPPTFEHLRWDEILTETCTWIARVQPGLMNWHREATPTMLVLVACVSGIAHVRPRPLRRQQRRQ